MLHDQRLFNDNFRCHVSRHEMLSEDILERLTGNYPTGARGQDYTLFGRSRIAFLLVPSTSTLWVSTAGSSRSAL